MTTTEIVDDCVRLMKVAIDVCGSDQAKLIYMEAKTKGLKSCTKLELKMERALRLQAAELAECYARLAVRQLLDKHTR